MAGDIICPYCHEIWDKDPPDNWYASGLADCESDGESEQGNCGATFWLITVEDGYKAHRRPETPEDIRLLSLLVGGS